MITGILTGNSMQICNISTIKKGQNTVQVAGALQVGHEGTTQLSTKTSSENCTWFGVPQFKNLFYELESVQRKRMANLGNICKMTSERSGLNSTIRETTEDM